MLCGRWFISTLKPLRLRGLPLQRVNILSTLVAQHQGLIIRSHTNPFPAHPSRQSETCQVSPKLDLPVANSYSKKKSPLLSAVEKDVPPITRPMRGPCMPSRE